MSSKRSADVISTLSSTASSSGGAPSGNKRPKHAPADIHVDPIRACLLNPDVPLAKMMLYLDVVDIPSAARVCKCWRDLMSTIEDELWLGLVRKHLPSVERITALLPDHVGKANNVASGDIPPPSRSWKRQFQRHRMINESTPRVPLPSQPLDSYFFEVQYTFYDTDADEVKKQVGIVIESANLSEYWGNSFIDLRYEKDQMIENLVDKNDRIYFPKNTFAHMLIRIFERSTGRQAVIYDMHHDHFICKAQASRPLANVIRSPTNERSAEIKLGSRLTVQVDHTSMVKMKLFCSIDIESDEDVNLIDVETTNLDDL